MASSLAVAPILLATTDQEWIRLGSMALLSTAAAVGITFVTRDTDPDVLDEFYRRVEPDGLWRATAIRVGDDPGGPGRRLRTGLATTLLTAASLFLVLIGLGRLAVGAPGGWFGPALIASAGLTLVPVWWRRLGDAEEPEQPTSDV